jgi:uncharacterized protein (DUF4213/DUF364 family)
MRQSEDAYAAQERASDWMYDAAARVLRGHYGEALEDLTIDRLVVGVFATVVALSNGCGGVAFTSPEIVARAGRRLLRGEMPAIRGRSAATVALGADVGPFTRIIRLATLNALSVPVIEERAQDAPTDEAEVFAPLVRGRRVCMVGAMIPLIKRLQELQPAGIVVADRKDETLAEASGCTVIDLPALPGALAACQTAIITGAAIANGSLSELLGQASPEAAVAVVGPTAGFVPEPLFSRGVALVGTTIVTDADRALDILAEGGGMYHLFQECLAKINLTNRERMRQLGLA